jgi:rubrerythrin
VEDDHTYIMVCGICDVETEITVFEQDERPLHCPMCGSEVEDVARIDEE